MNATLKEDPLNPKNRSGSKDQNHLEEVYMKSNGYYINRGVVVKYFKNNIYVALGFTLILLLALAVPASATVWPINTGNAGTSAQFQTWIDGASSNDTITLDPGIYYVNDLTFFYNITIESNQTNGGTEQNTILDGINSPTTSMGIIYNQSGTIDSSTITVENLTFRNGYSGTSYGGAAINNLGPINVSSSDFINDTSPGHDGGTLSIHGNPANITVSESNFINSTGLIGGAIYDDDGQVFVSTSSFINCNATINTGLEAGAIYGANGVNATFCRFSNITAYDDNIIRTNGGDIYAPDNWWGTNNPVQSTIFGGGGTYTINPWLNLTVTTTPVTTMGQTSTIQAYLKYYNNSVVQSGNIPTDGMPVTFTVSPLTSGSVNYLSSTFADMVSPIVTFSPLLGGPVTVDVAVDAETIPINFDIAPILTGINPATSVNTSAIPVTITGAGFYNTTTTLPTVNLTQNGYSNVTLTNVNVSSVTSINGTIPAGIPAGVWNVVITNPDGLESTNASVTFTATQYIPTPTITPTPIVTQHHGTPYNGGGQTGGNTQNGYTGSQPASGVPAKPVIQQPAPPEKTPSPIVTVTALAPVQNPSILAMVILTLQEYQFWLILAVIIIILVAILRRWWIKRQNPLLFKK
jgi:hypothetical protein